MCWQTPALFFIEKCNLRLTMFQRPVLEVAGYCASNIKASLGRYESNYIEYRNSDGWTLYGTRRKVQYFVAMGSFIKVEDRTYVQGAGELESGEPHTNTHTYIYTHRRLKVLWNTVGWSGGGGRVGNWKCNELYKFVTPRSCANQSSSFMSAGVRRSSMRLDAFVSDIPHFSS